MTSSFECEKEESRERSERESNRNERETNDAKDVVCEVEVDLGKGRGTEVLRIYEGQSLADLIEGVRRKYSLDDEETACLHQWFTCQPTLFQDAS